MQITSSFPIISLGDWVAGLHFMKELSGKKIERKLLEYVQKFTIHFRRNRFIRNDFSLKKDIKS